MNSRRRKSTSERQKCMTGLQRGTPKSGRQKEENETLAKRKYEEIRNNGRSRQI